MTEPLVPYRVAYSERVRQRLATLAEEAGRRGDRETFAAALKEFDRRLRLYPQFGDPLMDLTSEQGRIWNGIIRPLAMRYAIYEDRRLTVTALPILLPRADAATDAGPNE
jgi:hypothetical protein